MATKKKITSTNDDLTNDAGQTIDPLTLNVTQDVASADDQVRSGQFCDVVSGDYEGRYGVMTTVTSLTADGIPDDVIIRTRDDRDEDLAVSYADLRPAESGRR